MTREEFLCKKVEAVANGKIISVLNNRQEKNEGEISRLGLQGFLHSCGRLDPLLYLMILTRALTDEEFEEVKKQIEAETE